MSQMEISIPGFTILNGVSHSGKSTAIEYILHKYRKKIDYCIVFCNTCFTGKSFNFIPEKFVHNEYKEEVLINAMGIQSELVKQRITKNLMIVFDDCLFDKQFTSPSFKKLITMYRHFNISILLSTQFPNVLPPIFRANAFQVLIFQNTTHRAIQALYESYGQTFDTFNEFKSFMNKNTNNYQFIYINNREQENTIEKKYKVCKITKFPPKNWKLEFNTNLN